MSSQTFVAALWMLGSVASFCLMAIAGRVVSPALDTFEIMLYRSLTGVVVVLGLAVATGRMGQVSLRHMPLQIVRNLAHFTGQNLWFLAITIAPLAQVFAVEFTSPIWVLLLAPLVLGERVRGSQIIVAIAGFAGVLIVAQPFSGTVSIGLLYVGIAAVFFAIANLLTRRLTRTVTVTGILFWLTSLQLLFGLVAAGWDGDIAVPDESLVAWVVAIGLAGLCAHWCLTNALRLAPASTIMPVDFLRLPLIALVGTWIYSEALDPMVLIGGAVIFSAAWINLQLARPPKGQIVARAP